MQRAAIIEPANLTINVAAPLPVIDPIAIANGQATLGAISPDSMLDEPRKHGRKSRVEGTGVDPASGLTNNVGAAAGPVTADAIRMVGPEPMQDPGAVQKVVHQGIYRDHAGAGPPPVIMAGWRRQQDAGQGHR